MEMRGQWGMSEVDAIKMSDNPRTRTSLAADFQALGLRAGMTVILHAAMSKLGWVNGGPTAVIYAMMDVLTSEGTLVMPAHSTDLSDPVHWENPPIPKIWHQAVRDTMPLFDPQRTHTRQMGRIAETFRTWPDVWRSDHPQHSFTAWGRHAGWITDGHELAYSMGENSPLARIYKLDGFVLLLGVGHNHNTSFHLAEYRAGTAKPEQNNIPIQQENGRTLWQAFPDIKLDSDIFPAIGVDFEKTDTITIGKVGSAECRFFPQREGVDFAEAWLQKK